MMDKTAFKIFLVFSLTAAIIGSTLLVINFMGIAFIGSDEGNVFAHSPKRVLIDAAEALSSDEEVVLPQDDWLILIGFEGDVIWQKNKPSDVPESYTINDIAKMTRWFIEDYPVYVHTTERGLLVLGTPKNSVGKYNVEYSMAWFDSLPGRILTIFIINLCLAFLLAFIFGSKLYKNISRLTHAIEDLQSEKEVRLNEKGIFKNISHNINKTSQAIAQKNAKLKVRDNARISWVCGISHDIRTPLSVIMASAEEMEGCAENAELAEKIIASSTKIKNLIEDLNLISSLEYDMQPLNESRVRFCKVVRQAVAELLNGTDFDKYTVETKFCDEGAEITADERLLERAVFNIISNSVRHNENGCKITILQHADKDNIYLDIRDNGKGIPEEVIRKIPEEPKGAHGLGLKMAYRIIRAHGGTMEVRNAGGMYVAITLPLD